MPRITVHRAIAAPSEVVFHTVSDIRQFAHALPHVVDYEFLTEIRTGVGARFRETRRQGGKEMITELEVRDYALGERVRMVADSHGTVWDTLFEVAASNDSTHLTVTMDANSYKLLPKLMIPLFKGKIQAAVEKDMDLVKAYCEGQTDG